MQALKILISAWPLVACGGQVVAIKVPLDANPSAHYTCVPEGESGYACQSRYTFHQYDREVEVKRDECPYGVSRVYVETSTWGKVTRVQYTCATAVAGDFPKE